MSINILNPGPNVESAAITRLESTLGCSFPPSYREFLLKFNGGRPESNVFPISGRGSASVVMFFGIRGRESDYDILQERSDYRGRVPTDLLPIGEASGGNLICISTLPSTSGAVYFWDHEEEAEEDEPPSTENVYKVSDSFDGFWQALTFDDATQRVKLKEGEVIDSWVDPEFLKSLEK